jgi:hypothetical protein
MLSRMQGLFLVNNLSDECVWDLCSFIVACRLDAMKLVFIYFKLFSFVIILLHNCVVCFTILWYC